MGKVKEITHSQAGSYNLQEDYARQLKQLEGRGYAANLRNIMVPKGKALVELFVFRPKVPKVAKGKILVPESIKGNVKDLGTTYDSITAKYQGVRPIVRVVNMGEIPKDAQFFSEEIKEFKLFAVPSAETTEPATNPDFMQWYQFHTTNKNKGTASVAMPEEVRKNQYIPGYMVHWKHYFYQDPLNPEGRQPTDPLLFILPITKFQSPVILK